MLLHQGDCYYIKGYCYYIKGIVTTSRGLFLHQGDCYKNKRALRKKLEGGGDKCSPYFLALAKLIFTCYYIEEDFNICYRYHHIIMCLFLGCLKAWLLGMVSEHCIEHQKIRPINFTGLTLNSLSGFLQTFYLIWTFPYRSVNSVFNCLPELSPQLLEKVKNSRCTNICMNITGAGFYKIQYRGGLQLSTL